MNLKSHVICKKDVVMILVIFYTIPAPTVSPTSHVLCANRMPRGSLLLSFLTFLFFLISQYTVNLLRTLFEAPHLHIK